jgi:hypothetical protein
VLRQLDLSKLLPLLRVVHPVECLAVLAVGTAVLAAKCRVVDLWVVTA